jgi:pimeloyl-ACP methyl ester carboxylesterase
MFLAENLADRGYAALVYNGVHAGSDFRFSTFEDAVKETADAVAFMKSRGFDRIFLVGHSLGTPMVQYYAGESPDPAVKAVASFGPHISIPEVTRDSLLGPEAYAQFVAESRALVAQGKGNEIKLLPYREGRYIITSAKTFLSYRDVETSKAAVEPQVRKIKIPFAIVYDPTDNIQGIGSITPRESIAQRLKAAAVASPKVDILVVPAIKGESPLQAHTLQGNEAVATDKIVEWLNSVDLKPAPSLR